MAINHSIGKGMDYRITTFFRSACWFIQHSTQPSPTPPFRFATAGAGRDGFYYIEDDNFYIISAELLARGRIQRRLVLSYIKQFPDAPDVEYVRKFWYLPGSLAEVEERERWRIMTNVCAYYDRLGIPYGVVP